MKKVSILLFLLSLFSTTSAFAREAIVSCQVKVSETKLTTYISPHMPFKDMLTDCLSRSDLRLEIIPGQPFMPDEERPLFENEDGTTFSPEKRPDVAVCFSPERVFQEYVETYGEYVTTIIPRRNLDSSVLSGSQNERAKDLIEAQDACLKLSNLELVVVQN